MSDIPSATTGAILQIVERSYGMDIVLTDAAFTMIAIAFFIFIVALHTSN